MVVGMLWPWSWMVVALVILATTVYILLQNQTRGSFKGLACLPIIGQNIHFLRTGPRDFLLDCFTRYGDSFNISVLGDNITVVTSPEAIKFVLSTAHASFPSGYSKQFVQLIGQGKFLKPNHHPHYRKAVLAAVTGDGLLNLLPFINSLAEKTVKSWETLPVVNTVEEAQKYVFTVGMHVLWKDIEPGSVEMEFYRKGLTIIFNAIAVLPINLPGFYFHKALKAREVIVSRIQAEILRRREVGTKANDLLDGLMSIKEVEVPDYDICCIILGLMFAASVTTASLLPWVLKYLHDFPEVRQRVQEEQDSVRQLIVEDKSFSWFKPKSSMPYTTQVINEILRIESLASFVPRRAIKDVDYNGIAFRKGSFVWAATAAVQLNPEYYTNPREFDPSRFEEKPKSNTFMVFGQGPHMCPGNELAITETMFLIHHLITNYSWERYGPDRGVTPFPIRKPGGGFLVTVAKKPVT